MVIVMLVVDFHLSGCRSLKEKRHRITRIRDRFGKKSNVAVCESDYHDVHRQAQWSFVIVGIDRKKVDQTLAEIEIFLDTGLDALMTERELHEL
ncbi:MAG: DUF503 domain-containing protein [Thermodesulfobacteriota bacterium]